MPHTPIPLRPRAAGARFYGSFFNPQALTYATGWNFNTMFKPQIDALARIGANLFMYHGRIGLFGPGAVSLATYVARRCEVAAYCADKGMYVLPYGAFAPGVWGDGGAEPTNTQASVIFAAEAAALAQHKNCIGYITVDEPWDSIWSDSEVVANSQEQYEAIKPGVPANFPICTVSNTLGNTAPVMAYSGGAAVRGDNVAPFCDFFVFHQFFTTTFSASSALRFAYPNTELIIPSAVLSNEGDTDIHDKAASIFGLSHVNMPPFRGWGWWLTTDLTSSGLTWGLLNDDFTDRPTKVGVFQEYAIAGGKFPKRQPRRPGKPSQYDASKWGG
jgi:hypothetical protein